MVPLQQATEKCAPEGVDVGSEAFDGDGRSACKVCLECCAVGGSGEFPRAFRCKERGGRVGRLASVGEHFEATMSHKWYSPGSDYVFLLF